jgi:hypothetical protein
MCQQPDDAAGTSLLDELPVDKPHFPVMPSSVENSMKTVRVKNPLKFTLVCSIA